MKKSYKIEVDCANCANLMEEAARKTDGVANATVNFMTQKMIVEFAEGADAKQVMQADNGVQLSFFQLDDPVLCQIRDEILHLDINNLTPVEALNKLNDIKRIVTGK